MDVSKLTLCEEKAMNGVLLCAILLTVGYSHAQGTCLVNCTLTREVEQRAWILATSSDPEIRANYEEVGGFPGTAVTTTSC
jgi:hypothetical protein